MGPVETGEAAIIGVGVTAGRVCAAIAVGGAAACVPGGPVRAQVPDSAGAPGDTAVYQVEDLRVEASRPLATASGASAVRLSLSSPRVRPAPLLEEVLRELPFVQVRENSRGEAQLTLRGTESRQVAVLVDGIPLTLGWDARTDLSVIPLGAAREIQLFRGLSSVLHGPNVLGGVVEVDVARGRDRVDFPGPSLDLGIDETGAARGQARIGGDWDWDGGRLSIQGGAGVRHRDGVPLPGGVDQPDEAAGTAVDPGRRLNSDLDHVTGFISARYGAESGAWASLSSFAYRAEKGVPPELHVDNPRLWRYPEQARGVTVLSAGTAWGETPLGSGDLEASVGIDFGDQQIDSYETVAYRTIEARELSDDRTLTFRLLGDHSFGPGTLRGAFTLADTRHDERIDTDPEQRFRQTLYSVGLEVEQPVLERGGRALSEIRLTAGASYDRATTPETGVQPARQPIDAWGARFGGSALLADGAARLQLGVSRRVRFPSLRELYSGGLGRFVPNPSLQPEVLRTIEAGLTGVAAAGPGELEGQVVLFHQRFSDAIVRTGLSDGRFMRENRTRITASGLELLGAWRKDGVRLGGDLTWQNVRLTDPTAPAEQRRAEYQPEIAGSLELQSPVAGGIQGLASLEVIGRQFCVDPDAGGDLAVDRSARLDAGFTRRWARGPLGGIQATLSLDNLTDSVVFDQCGLPRPGRLLRFQIRIG